MSDDFHDHPTYDSQVWACYTREEREYWYCSKRCLGGREPVRYGTPPAGTECAVGCNNRYPTYESLVKSGSDWPQWAAELQERIREWKGAARSALIGLHNLADHRGDFETCSKGLCPERERHLVARTVLSG